MSYSICLLNNQKIFGQNDNQLIFHIKKLNQILFVAHEKSQVKNRIRIDCTRTSQTLINVKFIEICIKSKLIYPNRSTKLK